MVKPINVLILEDRPADAELMVHELRKAGFVPQWKRVDTREDYLINLDQNLDLILADHVLPQFNAPEALHLLKERFIDIPFIIVSGSINEELAVDCMKLGAADYLLKDRLTRIGQATIQALEANRLRKEKNRTEKNLIESEERYRTLVECSPDGIALVRRDIHLFVNQQVVKLFGYIHPNDLIGQPITMTIHPEDQQRVMEINRKRQKGVNVPLQYEFKALRKDGKAIDIEVSATRTTYQGERVSLAFLRDITDRKAAEEALRKSEQRFKLIAETIDEVIWMADSEIQKMFYVSSAYEKVWGRSRDSLYANPKSFLNAIHPEDQKRVLAGLEVQKTGQPFDQNYRIVRPDESIRWIWDRGFPIQSETGQITQYVGVAQDITERKKAEDDRQQTLEKLRQAIGGIIQVISKTVETRDPYTAGHQQRTAALAQAIAREMGIDADTTNGIHITGSIHDLGKISIPADILSKPTNLSEIEFSLIKTHAQTGYDILKNIDFPWPIAQMVLQHHERLDGSGYPFGLTGREILKEAMILAVADVVEAIASHRPYRPSHGIGYALDEISKNRGILYDPDAVDACLRIFYEKGSKLD